MRPILRPRALLLALLLVLPRCACEDELSELRPEVRVVPDRIDMGRRAVGRPSEAFFTVSNTGTAKVNLRYEIAPLDEAARTELGGVFVDAEGVAFAVADGPAEVGPQRSVDGHVRFTPPLRGRFGATLVVRSDDLERPELRVVLLGEGGPPLIEASPAELSFGVVNEGPGASRVVRLINAGYDYLNIASLRVVDEGDADGGVAEPVFTLGENQTTEAGLRIDEALSVEVRMNPNAAALASVSGGRLRGTLIVESDADNAPVLEVPLSGEANLAPRAVAVELITRRSTVKVGLGREVTIDGNDTVDPEGDPFTFSWELVDKPASSEAFLIGGLAGASCADDGECEVDDGYRCVAGSSGSRCRQVARTRVTPDDVGTYLVRLKATDSRGAFSTADAVILPRDLALVLTWGPADDASCYRPGTPSCDDLSVADQRLYCCGQTDLDLHLVRPEGTLGDYGSCPAGCVVDTSTDGGPAVSENRCFEDTDAFAATCRQLGTDCAYANRYPEWGATGRADDPRLDLDDVRGYGPEAITLNEPPDGVYSAVVHFCTDRITEPSLATLEVYVKGELRHTAGPQRIDQEGQAWVAATLLRTGGPENGMWTFVSVPDLFDANAPLDLCQQ